MKNDVWVILLVMYLAISFILKILFGNFVLAIFTITMLGVSPAIILISNIDLKGAENEQKDN